jgi:hypothetical protein
MPFEIINIQQDLAADIFAQVFAGLNSESGGRRLPNILLYDEGG